MCTEQTGRWISMHQNFDNIGWGMLSLFEIVTTEGWVDVMSAGGQSDKSGLSLIAWFL